MCSNRQHRQGSLGTAASRQWFLRHDENCNNGFIKVSNTGDSRTKSLLVIGRQTERRAPVLADEIYSPNTTLYHMFRQKLSSRCSSVVIEAFYKALSPPEA